MSYKGDLLISLVAVMGLIEVQLAIPSDDTEASKMFLHLLCIGRVCQAAPQQD